MDMVCPWFKACWSRQIHSDVKLRTGGIRWATGENSADFTLARKPSLLEFLVSVPQSDTGRWVEYTKANGRTFVKELGKLAP